MLWFEFILSATIIVAAGTRLTVCADKLSDRLQLGKVWIGVVLLGLVTSLPEAITSLTAVISLRSYDLAVGNLLGSNAINPMLTVIMDLLYRRGSVTDAVKPNRSHTVSAGFAILLTATVAAEILWAGRFPLLKVGWVSVGSVAVAVFYFFGMRRLARLSPVESVLSPLAGRGGEAGLSIPRIVAEFLASTVFVVGGGIWLARSADAIAALTGLGGTFFGSIFLALATSLPEMVVSLSALRLGAWDLAIGNIFGSNMTNMFILFICDLAGASGPLLGGVSAAHILTAVLSVLLVSVALGGIFMKNKKKFAGLGWDSWLMIVLYLSGTAALYRIR